MRGLNETVLVLAAAAGASYCVFGSHAPNQPLLAAWKGAGVALLALWTLLRVGSTSGRWIALVLALGALGDVLIAVVEPIAAALAFSAGHLVATWLYLRNRRARLEFAFPIAVAIAVTAWLLPADRGMAMGAALYALGLGAMTGTAFNSRYPRAFVGLGALLFAASDLLIFARMGPLRDSLLSGVAIWSLYFTGQLLIAVGVVQAETAEP
ncbi:MAG: lysoplasmalogenase [Mycobacteriaceae bacterium]|nr:lysoplasmalogenase [Mycobacteriaceae bacterium]